MSSSGEMSGGAPEPSSAAAGGVAGADSLADRLRADLRFAGKGFADLGSPISPLRTAAAITSSSSSSSGSFSGKPAGSNAGGRRSHSGELSVSSETGTPVQAAGIGSTACSTAANVLPCGNIFPSGKIGKTRMMMSRSVAGRNDVLGSGNGNYGHGSIMRGGGGIGGGRNVPAASAAADSEELTRVGNEHYKLRQFANALRFYDRAVSLCPDNAACRSNRAAALAGLGRLGDAVGECEEALRLDPSSSRAHHRLALLNLRLGRVENARQHLFMSARHPDPVELQKLQDVEKHLAICADIRKVEDWKGALREVDAAIAAGADASSLLNAARSEALLRLHQLKDAESAMSSATKLASLAQPCPRTKFFGMHLDSYLHIVQARIHMAFGRFEDALASAEKSREIDPRSVEATLVLNNVRAVSRARARGNELFNAGKFSEACIAYGEGLEQDSSNPVLYCNRSACRFMLGQWEKTVEDCDKALRIQPNYPKVLKRRAASYGKLERWVEAVRDYELISMEQPNDNEVKEALFHARVALRTSRGEEVSNMNFGGEVEELTSLEQFQEAISLHGVSVVHFMAAQNQQCIKMSPIFDALCRRYPSANFLKADVEVNPAIAEAENVRIVPTFKIYKGGERMKEMICPSHLVLDSSMKHYCL